MNRVLVSLLALLATAPAAHILPGHPAADRQHREAEHGRHRIGGEAVKAQLEIIRPFVSGTRLGQRSGEQGNDREPAAFGGFHEIP